MGFLWSYFCDLTCVIMFLRRIERRKNGKTHLYWSVVENKRLDGGRVVQRHVLYLGEINSSQAGGVAQAVAAFDTDAGGPRTLALFPEDRGEVVSADDASMVRLRLSEMRLHRPRQWGACWLAGLLWRELQLDRFWVERLPASRKRTRWNHVLQVLVAYRLIEPGSEWRLHPEWFGGAPWPTCWGRISAWPRRTSSIPATICCLGDAAGRAPEQFERVFQRLGEMQVAEYQRQGEQRRPYHRLAQRV
jgi:hypothetical protein